MTLRIQRRRGRTRRGAGCPAVDVGQSDDGQSDDGTWVVLADPEGNEFCVLRALTPDD